MKVITEINEEVHYITEGAEGAAKQYFIEGVFLQSAKLNRNGRYYPKEIMEREVARYTRDYINTNRAFGELGHPANPSINLDRVSHMIKGLRCEGTDYIGRAKILDTPYGKIVKSLIDEGARIGVSSRGLGSLKESNGSKIVQDDFHLTTAADIVADPSAPDAFVRGIMEGKEWILEGGHYKEIDYDKSKKMLETASRNDYEQVKLRLFEDFLSKLSNS
jgi:hypothetical protein